MTWTRYYFMFLCLCQMGIPGLLKVGQTSKAEGAHAINRLLVGVHGRQVKGVQRNSLSLCQYCDGTCWKISSHKKGTWKQASVLDLPLKFLVGVTLLALLLALLFVSTPDTIWQQCSLPINTGVALSSKGTHKYSSHIISCSKKNIWMHYSI